MKRPHNTIDAFQPDLFGGEGIQRPAPDTFKTRAEELAQAREEMMAAGARTIFDAAAAAPPVYCVRLDGHYASTAPVIEHHDTLEDAEAAYARLAASGGAKDKMSLARCQGWDTEYLRRERLTQYGPKYQLSRFQVESGWTLEKLQAKEVPNSEQSGT